MRAFARLLAMLLLPTPVLAEDSELPVHACADAVGTFLMKETLEDGTTLSRSLIALTNGGHIMFIGSDEQGESGYAPFSDGLGRWRCLSRQGETPMLSAIILDFTFPSGSEQRLARVDLEGTVDPINGTLNAKATLSFFPLDVDPLNSEPSAQGGEFILVGHKIIVP
jgi:hypothetical protein